VKLLDQVDGAFRGVGQHVAFWFAVGAALSGVTADYWSGRALGVVVGVCGMVLALVVRRSNWRAQTRWFVVIMTIVVSLGTISMLGPTS